LDANCGDLDPNLAFLNASVAFISHTMPRRGSRSAASAACAEDGVLIPAGIVFCRARVRAIAGSCRQEAAKPAKKPKLTPDRQAVRAGGCVRELVGAPIGWCVGALIGG